MESIMGGQRLDGDFGVTHGAMDLDLCALDCPALMDFERFGL